MENWLMLYVAEVGYVDAFKPFFKYIFFRLMETVLFIFQFPMT